MERQKNINKKVKKLKLLAIGITIILIVSGSLFLLYPRSSINASDNPYSDNPYDSKISSNLFQPSSLNETIEAYALNPQWNEITEDYRPHWAGASDEEFKQIFGNLPKMPQDFYKKYKMFMEGKLTDYDRLGPEYWMQPEFYGLNQLFFNTYINRPANMWRIGQISCKPSFRYIEVKPGATLQLSTFFHTEIIGSEAYLGGIIHTIYPDSAMNQEGTVIFKQPDNAEQYITARIISPDNDPIFSSDDFQQKIKGKNINVNDNDRLLLFPAAYSKIDVKGEKQIVGFPESWCYKVTAEFSIANNCPKGDYVVALDIINPSWAIIEEYNWIISGYPYYHFFFPAIREWHPVCPFFQVLITVT